MFKRIIIAVFILSLAVFVSPSFAGETMQSFEAPAHAGGHGFCSGGVVKLGDLKGVVVSKCGVPDFTDVISKNPKVEVMDFYGDLMLKLTFEKAKLTKIEKLEKKK